MIEIAAAVCLIANPARCKEVSLTFEAEAITTVFGAIHAGNPDAKLLAYQYLQTLPKLAEGDSNKMWIIPSELTEALKGISEGFFGGKPPAGK